MRAVYRKKGSARAKNVYIYKYIKIYIYVCVCKYDAWAVESGDHMGAGIQWVRRKRRWGTDVYVGVMDVVEGGASSHLQLPLPHSHFPAHEWGEGRVCANLVSVCMRTNQSVHSWSGSQ